MLINNKIEKTFSGPLSIAGAVFLLATAVLILNYRWIFGGFSFAVSAFILFTYSGIEIDCDNKRIKPYYKVFGFWKRGKWEPLSDFAGLTLIPMNKVYTTYSRSNRKNEYSINDFRVFLVNHRKKPAFALKVCKTREEAQNSMDEFAIWLHLPVYSVKK